MTAQERKLAAIMFTDMVSYSALALALLQLPGATLVLTRWPLLDNAVIPTYQRAVAWLGKHVVSRGPERTGRLATTARVAQQNSPEKHSQVW